MGRFDGYLICSDIDGTLSWGGVVPEENVAALSYFLAEGGRFTFATGRAPEYRHKLPLPINAPMISENGARITDPLSHRPLWTFPLDGCGLLLEWLDRSSCPKVGLHFQDEQTVVLPGKVAETVLSHTTGDLLKIVCFDFADEGQAVSFQQSAIDCFGARYQVFRSWSVGVEFVSPLGGKGNCMDFLREICEDVHTVVGMGDYENDISLLQRADRSFAPSNACSGALAAAQRVVCSCEKGALAEVIRILDAEL